MKNNKQQLGHLRVSAMNSFQYILFLMTFLLTSSAWAVSITDVEFSSLPGGKVEIKFDFDGSVPDPKVYTIESPARIALDLEGVSSTLKQKKTYPGSR
jgi:type IV pilus assembly protein PilQ